MVVFLGIQKEGLFTKYCQNPLKIVYIIHRNINLIMYAPVISLFIY
jgi:hypothetical protein